jgi:Peptidase A4 family
VSGNWTLPAVQCPRYPYQNQGTYLVNWVGIDGVTTGTVEQLGTGAQCFEGVLYYYVWYEMYPAGTVEEGTTACINNNVNCPEPGDQISASVDVTPGSSGENNYTLALVDHTRPDESFSVGATCATTTCQDASAEWIVERPAYLPSADLVEFVPLAAFGRTFFSRGDVTSGGHSSNIQGFKDGPIYYIPMVDDSISYYLACPGQPNPPGSLLLFSNANACQAVSPFPSGGFQDTWDVSF